MNKQSAIVTMIFVMIVCSEGRTQSNLDSNTFLASQDVGKYGRVFYVEQVTLGGGATKMPDVPPMFADGLNQLASHLDKFKIKPLTPESPGQEKVVVNFAVTTKNEVHIKLIAFRNLREQQREIEILKKVTSIFETFPQMKSGTHEGKPAEIECQLVVPL